MKLRSIESVKDLKGKRVLVRADFNVPINKRKIDRNGEWRLKTSIGTINFLMRSGAKILLASHRGRPEGRRVRSLSLSPIAKRLAEMVGKNIKMLPNCVGPKVAKAVAKMQDGSIVMLENLRFNPGEESNDKKFAKELADNADLYVNEAFAVSHRESASLVAVTDELATYAGFQLLKEVEALEKVMTMVSKPYIVIIGGAKVSTKLGLIETMLNKADNILLGGALIVPFFQVRGYGVGSSLYGNKDLKAAENIIASKKFKKIILPLDVVVGNIKDSKKPIRVVDLLEQPFDICKSDDESILDIGPKTISAFASFIRSAKTLIWNGPLGYFEIPKFSHGTISIGRLIAARSNKQAYGVVGGGETVMALERTGLQDCVDHISTGGGAMLKFLEGGEMPGIKALQKKK